MLKRIVQLTFKPDNAREFVEEVFEKSKDQIRAFPGCKHMELLRHAQQPHVYFTLSIWESEDDLERYRQSPLFEATWAKTKALFAEKAMASSVELIDPDPRAAGM